MNVKQHSQGAEAAVLTVGIKQAFIAHMLLVAYLNKKLEMGMIHKVPYLLILTTVYLKQTQNRKFTSWKDFHP